MKLLANENFPGAAVQALRSAGFDVVWVRTEMPGAQDEEILARTQQESRIVVTFDKDFGELAYRFGMPAECGIILLRLRTQSPQSVATQVLEVLQRRDDWEGSFAVVEERTTRFRPLPPKNRT